MPPEMFFKRIISNEKGSIPFKADDEITRRNKTVKIEFVLKK
jgi:hypothetical protein